MVTGVYRILLRKGLMIKMGLISIRLVDQKLNGTITISNRENEFTGTYRENEIYMEGVLKLSIGEVYYSAKGKVVNDTITLELTTDKGLITIKGKRQR